MKSEEPTRKKVINETIVYGPMHEYWLTNFFGGANAFALHRWSSKCSDYPAGDPELHHFIGSLYANGLFSLLVIRLRTTIQMLMAIVNS